MREFLFHGKRKDNGKWVEGYLFIAKWYLNDEKFTAIMRTDATAYPHCEISGWEEVDPETVGQYTELTDKNGKKMFEGDIVVSTSERRLSNKPEIVKYCPLSGYWMCDPKREPVVIGNIHDNPELL